MGRLMTTLRNQNQKDTLENIVHPLRPFLTCRERMESFITTVTTCITIMKNHDAGRPKASAIPTLIKFSTLTITHLEEIYSSSLLYQIMEINNMNLNDARNLLETLNNNNNNNSINITDLRLKMFVVRKSSHMHSHELNSNDVVILHIRHCLELHIRFSIPLLSLIISRPLQYNLLGWIEILIKLLLMPLVYRENHPGGLFELIIDILGWLVDETPKDHKSDVLNFFRTIRPSPNMPTDVLIRVSAILPFNEANIYFNDLLLSSTRVGPSIVQPLPAKSPSAALVWAAYNHFDFDFKPWEWLEEGSSPSVESYSISINNTPISLSTFSTSRCRLSGPITYEKLRINGWKRKIPEMANSTSRIAMLSDRIEDLMNSDVRNYSVFDEKFSNEMKINLGSKRKDGDSNDSEVTQNERIKRIK